MYNLNVPSRWGTQTPFTNLTFDWTCPEDLRHEVPVVGDLDCGDVNGPVRVTGSDPYRLDADGDGIGCDS